MPRKRSVTIEAETTTVRVTAEETITGDTAPIIWAPGWADHAPDCFCRDCRAHLERQAARCVAFLALWAESSHGYDPVPGPEALATVVPPRLVPDAAIILRAGPTATPLELTLGRSV